MWYKYFPISPDLRRSQESVHAVDGVSLEVRRGETLGLVGETGCGKSTLARCITRCYDLTSGTIRFDGQDITKLSARQMRPLRREMQMIFQDPYGSLNPQRRVGSIIGDPFAIHDTARGQERKRRVQELMELVGLNPEHFNRFPAEFSGGQRQRIGVARALALHPKLIICDEPVSALDVSIQAQILNLLTDLQRAVGPDLHLHRARPLRRPACQRPARAHVPGQGGRVGTGGRDLPSAAPPLHERPALGGSRARPETMRTSGSGSSWWGTCRRPINPPSGVPLPPPLPQGPGPLRRGGADARAPAR